MRIMKRHRYFILLIILISAIVAPVCGQPPSPPGNHGMNGNQGVGGAAPVDGGLGVMLLCACGYFVVKRWKGGKVDK